MRHFVQNNALEKSDEGELELGYYDYGQLCMAMSTVRKNSDDLAKLTPQYIWN